MLLLEATIRVVDLFLSGIVADPIATKDLFTWLECLIDLEEVFDFIEFIDGDICEILNIVLADISGSNAEELVIAALFIGHAEHSDNAA
jgi:hypothetical protein